MYMFDQLQMLNCIFLLIHDMYSIKKYNECNSVLLSTINEVHLNIENPSGITVTLKTTFINTLEKI